MDDPGRRVAKNEILPPGITTGRLFLRELEEADLPDLAEILQDPLAMRAYEGPFTDGEVADWLQKQRRRYREDGFGLWAVALRGSGELVGQAGLTRQPLREETVCEVGYLFKRRFWHHGYATEAAVACRDHAFSALGQPAVYSIIRAGNTPSVAVARRNGMQLSGTVLRYYRGVDMIHLVYRVARDNYRPAAEITFDIPTGTTYHE